MSQPTPVPAAAAKRASVAELEDEEWSFGGNTIATSPREVLPAITAEEEQIDLAAGLDDLANDITEDIHEHCYGQ